MIWRLSNKCKHGKLEATYKELVIERRSDESILPGKIEQIKKMFEVPKQTNVILWTDKKWRRRPPLKRVRYPLNEDHLQKRRRSIQRYAVSLWVFVFLCQFFIRNFLHPHTLDLHSLLKKWRRPPLTRVRSPPNAWLSIFTHFSLFLRTLPSNANSSCVFCLRREQRDIPSSSVVGRWRNSGYTNPSISKRLWKIRNWVTWK